MVALKCNSLREQSPALHQPSPVSSAAPSPHMKTIGFFPPFFCRQCAAATSPHGETGQVRQRRGKAEAKARGGLAAWSFARSSLTMRVERRGGDPHLHQCDDDTFRSGPAFGFPLLAPSCEGALAAVPHGARGGARRETPHDGRLPWQSLGGVLHADGGPVVQPAWHRHPFPSWTAPCGAPR